MNGFIEESVHMSASLVPKMSKVIIVSDAHPILKGFQSEVLSCVSKKLV